MAVVWDTMCREGWVGGYRFLQKLRVMAPPASPEWRGQMLEKPSGRLMMGRLEEPPCSGDKAGGWGAAGFCFSLAGAASREKNRGRRAHEG